MSKPPGLEKLWQEAASNGGTPVSVGRYVICDGCDKDFTDSTEKGGLIFGSKAYGPCCAPRIRADAQRYHEERFIRGECPAYSSFADWVRKYREDQGATAISIQRLAP